MWLTVFAIITFVFGTVLGLMAIFGAMPGFENVDPSLSSSWGGRALGLGLVALFAVLLKNPYAYIVAFIGGASRDVGDLIGELQRQEPSIGVLIITALFLIGSVWGIVAAYKARNPQIF